LIAIPLLLLQIVATVIIKPVMQIVFFRHCHRYFGLLPLQKSVHHVAGGPSDSGFSPHGKPASALVLAYGD
jgi:hypothetical protein